MTCTIYIVFHLDYKFFEIYHMWKEIEKKVAKNKIRKRFSQPEVKDKIRRKRKSFAYKRKIIDYLNELQNVLGIRKDNTTTQKQRKETSKFSIIC